MSNPPSIFLGDRHGYTRSSTPWLLDEDHTPYAETSSGKKFGWRLFHYLAGGGMKTFGRTVRQEELDARRTRFLVLAAVVAAGWALMLLF